MQKRNTLCIVIPCYNEEEILNDTIKKLLEKIKELIDNKIIKKDSFLLIVDDGSKDNTWNIIKENYKKNKIIKGIKLSSNRGHQNALYCGLMIAKEQADIIISIDADLQDDITIIDEMIHKYNDGNEIIYGVRKNRKKDSFFKKTTAQLFYKIMRFMGVEIIYNHANYRLTSKRVLDELENYKEVNLFLRGIFPLMGFKHTIVYYDRLERKAGKTKYSLKKMTNLAIDGITSFTIKPLKMIMSFGSLISLFSLLFLIYVIIGYYSGNTVSGWTTIIVLICFFSGIQILCLGIIGEYIGRIYMESKHRPRYIIEEELK